MEPSTSIIPFEKTVSFKKSDLLSLKESNIERVTCSSFNISTLTTAYSFVSINSIENKIVLFLYLVEKDAERLEPDLTINIDSANFSKKFQPKFGVLLGEQSEFFDGLFFKDDEMIVKVTGTFKIVMAQRARYPLSINWKIEFATINVLEAKLTSCVKSARFTVPSEPDIKYYLSIYPYGNNQKNNGKVGFILSFEGRQIKRIHGVFNLSIESVNYTEDFHLRFLSNTVARGGKHFCTTEELFDPTKKFFAAGILKINISGTILIQKKRYEQPSLSIKWKPINFRERRSGCEDFSIIADGKEIKVHKKVMADSSPVFAGMFQSGMKEAQENKVEITDFSYAVIDAVVKLLYHAGFPEEFSYSEMLSLLQFSDKYDIKCIKTCVEDYLIEKLSQINACQLIHFSTTVNAEKLRLKAFDFIVKCCEEKKVVHGLETLDKDLRCEILQKTISQTVENPYTPV